MTRRIKSLSVEEIQAFDRFAIEDLGIPSIVLMENAGRAVAEAVWDRLKNSSRAKVSIVCGLGNNAGDGFVAGRHLRNRGVTTNIFLIGSAEKLKADAAVNYRILKKIPCPIVEGTAVDDRTKKILKESSVIVDAIFGVGLNRPITEPFKGMIETINALHRPVVSADIPSGLDGTTGRIWGVCIKAAVTVTMSFPKKGFYQGQGPYYIGKVVVADIGISSRLATPQGQ